MNSIIVDLFNGFSPKDLPLLLIQTGSAAVLTLLLGGIYYRSWKIAAYGRFIVAAVVVALLTVFAKYSIPLAVLTTGWIIGYFLYPVDSEKKKFILPLSIAAGIGMGAGYVAVTWIIFLVFVLPLILLSGRDQ